MTGCVILLCCCFFFFLRRWRNRVTTRLFPEPRHRCCTAAVRLSTPRTNTQQGWEWGDKATPKTSHKAHRRIMKQPQPKSPINCVYLFRQAPIFTSERSGRSNRSLHEFPPATASSALLNQLQPSVYLPRQHVTVFPPRRLLKSDTVPLFHFPPHPS